jgi:hypothetical protein
MEIKTLFNILLLSLSLATLLITLVSYLLYKLRQIAVQNQPKGLIRLDGVFFKRHAPHFKQLNDQATLSVEKKKSTRDWMAQMGWLLSIVTVVVATTFLIEGYFHERKIEQKKVVSAENLRRLMDMGILKRYPFDPSSKVDTVGEFGGNSRVLDQIENWAHMLASGPVVLWEINRNKKFHGRTYALALKRWSEFGARIGLKIDLRKDISKLPPGSLVIVPQAKSMSAAEWQTVMGLIEKGTHFLFTGPVGVLDGTGAPASQDFAQKIGLHLNPIKRGQWPTHWLWDRSTKPVDHEIPSGLVLDWKPLDFEFGMLRIDGGSETVVESYFNGRPVTGRHTSLKLFEQKSWGLGSWLWTAVDPLETQPTISLENAEFGPGFQIFQDHFIIERMADLLGLPKYRILPYLGQKKAAAVVTLDIGGDLDWTKELLSFFKSEQMFPTLYLARDDIKAFAERFTTLDPLLSLGLKVEATVIEKWSGLRDAFEYIEAGRLDIEEMASRAVSSIRLPHNKLSPSVFNSIAQNQLKTVFVEQGIQRLALVSLNGTTTQLLPESVYTTAEVLESKATSSPQVFLSEMESELKRVVGQEGVWVQDVSTSIVEKKEYYRVLKKFFSTLDHPEIWVTTLPELDQRVRQLNQLSFKIIRTILDKRTGFKIIVKNQSDQILKDLVVQLDFRAQKNWTLQGALPGTGVPSTGIPATEWRPIDRTRGQLSIAQIGAGEELQRVWLGSEQ